ncbi:MAG: peptide deformylase [Bacillota bacterium]|nr:peptide deformylase [Bacillota bacterium]
MAQLRTIILDGDPILREQAIEVRRFSSALHKLLDDMKFTMYHENGVGLAAPQIGVSKQLVVIDDREGGFVELVNPQIIEAKGCEEGVEFCLSVPGRGGRVLRAAQIKVKAQDRFGKPFTLNVSGQRARVFQHEIDHLQGKLFTDVMTEEFFGESGEEPEDRGKRGTGAKERD